MLTVYTEKQKQEWDSVVRSFPNYDVYWLNGYVKAFYLHGDGEPLLFYYEDDNIRGMQVVMKRDIADDSKFNGKLEHGRWFDFITPYGYGGWLFVKKSSNENVVDPQETTALIGEYERACSDNNIVSEFVRFHPILENHKCLYNKYSIAQRGPIIVMDISSEEKIWANLISKNRCAVRKAIKSGIEIYHGHYPQIYEKFHAIYNATMDKDSADSYYYFDSKFYASILEDLKQNAQVFYAELDGKIVAASIILAANGHLTYHLSGSVKEYQTLAPTNLLLYEAALWGCTNGCKTFLLGGGVGSAEDSLYKFKKAFYRMDSERFFIGKKIFNQNAYDYLCAQRNIAGDSWNINDGGYFPHYRRAG